MNKLTFYVAVFLLAGTSQAWQPPVNLGDAVNTNHNEWYPVIAEDGSCMIFVSDRPGGLGDADLWITFLEDGSWCEPINMGSNVNTPFGESAPFLAENDSKLYFLSADPTGHGGGDIWFCPFTGDAAGPRENLGTPINSPALECCPLPSPDGSSLYFCSTRSGGEGGVDVWISERSGGFWGEPFNAGSKVNSTGTDCPRWISSDGESILLCSTGPGGYGGADMYSVCIEGDSLGNPENLGPELNSPAAEWGAWFQDNAGGIGGTIFFGSGRAGGFGGLDIWFSTQTEEFGILSWGEVKSLFLFRGPENRNEKPVTCRTNTTP
ncbi:MAG: hypothetical protein R6V62_10925 [Candidatus Fermentibacteraceae bacterium]